MTQVKPTLLTQFRLGKSLAARLAERYTLLGPCSNTGNTENKGNLARPATDLLAEGDAAKVQVVITTGGIGLAQDMVDRLPNLKLVHTLGAGYERVDQAALRARGIALANGRGGNASCVADMAMALLLALSRQLLPADRYVREGRWASLPVHDMDFMPGLGGKRVGIIGLGEIGLRIAKRAEPFEVEIGYFNRSPRRDVAYPYFSDAMRLAEWSDYLVIACPLTEATRGLVDRALLEALGPQGMLVNIGRGAVIDEPALIDALRSGAIAGAGLDVFEREPGINKAFFTLPNAVLTPHLGGCTVRASENLDQILMDNLAALFAGRPLLTAVLQPGV